jgi:hypothetical protein
MIQLLENKARVNNYFSFFLSEIRREKANEIKVMICYMLYFTLLYFTLLYFTLLYFTLFFV